jgi:hypothetical protein
MRDPHHRLEVTLYGVTHAWVAHLGAARAQGRGGSSRQGGGGCVVRCVVDATVHYGITHTRMTQLVVVDSSRPEKLGGAALSGEAAVLWGCLLLYTVCT